MLNSTWMAFLSTQVWAIPHILICVVGGTLALVFWRRHPAVSLLCLTAFVLMLGSLLIGSGLQFWLLQTSHRDAPSMQISKIMSTVSAVRMVISVAAWILILIAMFGWRSTREQKPAF